MSPTAGASSVQRGGVARRWGALGVMVALAAAVGFIAAWSFTGQSRRGRTAATEATLATVASAIKSYTADTGSPPVSLEALMTKGFLGSAPTDAWGEDLRYLAPGPRGEKFELRSAGADKELGTDDDLIAH
jgi:type II secretory pathway pseudopilin PulG